MKLFKGIKIGVSSGLIIAVISLPVNYYLLAIKYREELSTALGRSYYPSLEGFLLLFVLTVLVFTACGVLYVLFFDKFPFKSPFWNAFILGAIIFVISRFGDFITDYPLSPKLAVENAIWSVPLTLILWPFIISRFYRKK